MEDRINNALEALLYDIYTERGISSGDITTEQLIALNKEVD